MINGSFHIESGHHYQELIKLFRDAHELRAFKTGNPYDVPEPGN